jgi:DNA-binding NarL/FixJ family response regulator
MKIKVVLADGRKMLREGQGVLLEKHDDMKIVAEADDPTATAALVRAVGADVVVLNTGSLAPRAREAVRAIAAGRTGIRIIVCSLAASAEFVREVFAAGVTGCLTKECASEELAIAIRTVMSGNTYLSPSLAGALVGYMLPRDRARSQRNLSIREQDILQRIADGQTTKEIARTLGVSSKTVETHRRRIMEKLGRHSVAQLTKYAVSSGLTSLEA